MIIEQTVEIPANHRLILELPLPENIPAGLARVVTTIVPDDIQYEAPTEGEAWRWDKPRFVPDSTVIINHT
jgi:hypothetical protein